MEIFVNICIIVGPLLGIYYIWKSFDDIPFNVHKSQNSSYYIDLVSHSDLSRFISEFESVKSILGMSRDPTFHHNDNGSVGSLFQIQHSDPIKAKMNGNIFVINQVKYIAKNKSDYKKATKIIKNHFEYCKKNNIYSNWI